MSVKQLWGVNYQYLQTMNLEAVHPRRQFWVIADSEREALDKGDRLFATISKYHAQLVGGETEVYDHGDPKGYGILSNLKKEAKVNEGQKYNLEPTFRLDGLDAEKFDLETVVEKYGQQIKVTYVPKPKTS